MGGDFPNPQHAVHFRSENAIPSNKGTDEIQTTLLSFLSKLYPRECALIKTLINQTIKT
jgi:hypothetical protein